MSVLEAAIGWLAPPQCVACGREGLALCEACLEAEIIPYGERCFGCGELSVRAKTCERCRRAGSPAYVWVSTTHDQTAQELIKLFKFQHLRAAARPTSELMARTFWQMNGDEQIERANYMVVPVPTATSRKRRRSFGHAELLAKSVAGKLDMDFRPVLGRLGQERQVGALRVDRLKQPSNKYYVRSPKKVFGRSILLVDDVVTTGSTLSAAAKQLRQAGARRVSALVFAKRL